MDSALLRQSQAMKERAMSHAGALAGGGGGSTYSSSSKSASQKSAKKTVKSKGFKRPVVPVAAPRSPPTSSQSIRSIAAAAAAAPLGFRTKNKFGVLKIIVDHMRARHKDRQTQPLSFEEILREIKYTDMSPNMQQFLQDALKANPKIACRDDGFVYKPQYQLETRRNLLELLKSKDDEGLGAVKMSDILESLPAWDKQRVLNMKQVMSFTRPDKEMIVFFNSLNLQLPIPDEYRQLWRGVSVEGLNDGDVESYLKKAGISTMQDPGRRKPTSSAVKQKKKRAKQINFLNSHLTDDLLKDYSNPSEEQ